MMNIKRVFTLLAVSVLPFGMSAQAESVVTVPISASPKVTIRSEIASPIVLENVQDKNYLKVSLVGFPLEIKKRSPINLALVIDRSTSMSGERIERARDAAIMAVNMLESDDTLSIVAYDSNVEVVVPATKVKNKPQLEKIIRQHIKPRGMTALFAGVSKGIDQVSKHLDKEQVNRIILLSDGQANVGPTSNSELAGLAKMAAKKGVAITTLGIGNGYNEDLMTAIAGYSDGNHAFVEKSSDLEKTFAREFNDVMSVVAQDVEVIIRTADEVRPVRLLGRDGVIKGNTVTVKLNQLYANQEKYVMLEVIPAKGKRSESKPLAEVSVSYDNMMTKNKESHQEELAVSYTHSTEDAKKAVVEEVLVDFAIQEAAVQNEQAIKLMDEGRMDDAKAVLDRSAAGFSHLPVQSEAMKQKVEENARINKQMGERIISADKAVSRKELKAQNYDVQMQKSSSK